jgi:hypothetical protein
MVGYLCMLFVGDGFKRRPRCIILLNVGLKRNTGESRRNAIVRNVLYQVTRLPVEFSTNVTLVSF